MLLFSLPPAARWSVAAALNRLPPTPLPPPLPPLSLLCPTPQFIFFIRIFADILGRFLPRLSAFAARSPTTPLALAGLKLLGVPLFLGYIKSPEWMHSDVLAGVWRPH